MNELITLKGTNNGLQLFTAKDASFEQVKESLDRKLAASAKFFIKDTVIYWFNPAFSKHQQQILSDVFKKYHLLLKIKFKTETPAPAAKKEESAEKLFPVRTIERTVRGGEEIIYKGSIVVYGNVNPGAKIVAGGNIDIHGRCRGIVHAGAFGDAGAYIVADNLSPLQIRIADFIARSPDNAEESAKLAVTEKAAIKDGNIVLEPFDR